MEDEEVADSWEEAADSGVRNNSHSAKPGYISDLAMIHGTMDEGTTPISMSFLNVSR